MRYFIEISYLGKNYHGWQIQPDQSSVQGCIIDMLSKILNTKMTIYGAGRTDTGVHSSQMFAHFDCEKELDIYKKLYQFNALLPNDIVIKDIFRVKNEAHARFDALSRTYQYHISTDRNPFETDLVWLLFNINLDIEAMNEACNEMMTHTNFKCFSKSKTQVNTYDCDITEAYWIKKNGQYIFTISANRFLRNMVRSIVGTMIEIGKGQINRSDFIEIIKSENRCNAGISVPAKGLFLTKIEYPDNIKI
ncbi:MAG: tRNA pseudouridine(38-40) synthase TruA [Flavobacteriaceae bacterium]|nr:tRNA pseudouridine(38-40) synthase TruA [Flavobacteriaceae bacterium]